PDYFSRFYLRRALRILPVYAIMLAVYYCARAAGAGPAPLFDGPFPYWTYAFFLQNVVKSAKGNYGPLWLVATVSVAGEEQFYLLFPLVVALVPFARLPRVLGAIMLGAVVIRVIAYKKFGHPAAYVFMPCRADTLAIGALIAWAMKDEATRLVLEAKASL